MQLSFIQVGNRALITENGVNIPDEAEHFLLHILDKLQEYILENSF